MLKGGRLVLLLIFVETQRTCVAGAAGTPPSDNCFNTKNKCCPWRCHPGAKGDFSYYLPPKPNF